MVKSVPEYANDSREFEEFQNKSREVAIALAMANAIPKETSCPSCGAKHHQDIIRIITEAIMGL